MKCCIAVLLACGLLLSPSPGEAKTAGKAEKPPLTYEVRGNELFAVGPKGTPAVALTSLVPVQGADLRFAALRGEHASEELPPGVESAFYFIKPDNTIVKFTGASEDPDDEHGLGLLLATVDHISMSPDGKVLAFSSSPLVIGKLYFYTWPEMEWLDMNHVTYYQTDADRITRWVNNREIALEGHSDPGARICFGDPCVALSVFLYNPYTGIKTPLLGGSDLCDVTIKDVKPDRITLNQLCNTWGTPWKGANEDNPGQTITIPLPTIQGRSK